MGVKTSNDNVVETKYTFNRKDGRNIIERRPVFSPDGESVAVIVENVIRVYNIQTGDCVRTLETEKEVKELVGIDFPEDANHNLYACSDCGHVIIWTWENGTVLREVKLAFQQQVKVLTFNLINSIDCVITTGGPSLRSINLFRVCIQSGNLFQYTETTPLYTEMVQVAVGLCNEDMFAVLSNGTKTIYIQNLDKHDHTDVIQNCNSFRVTAVAAHKEDSVIAIADTLGRITVFRGFLTHKKNIAREVMHWHSIPPMAVCFSGIGNYLYSGGMEKVLLKWTIGNLSNKANEKEFIPRLPGMIRFIATNNTHVAVSLSNNSIIIATTQDMRVKATILECGGLSPTIRSVGGALLMHRRLGALIVGGRTGHLQLYSTTTNKVMYNIDITRMNNIVPVRANLMPLDVEVTCAAIDAHGSWLVTSEYRYDGLMYPEEMLKFWKLQGKADPFRLITCVNLSHGGCNVVSLALNFDGSVCVSAGADQKFRIWKRKNYYTKYNWYCLTACYYSSGTSKFLSSKSLNCFKVGPKFSTGGEVDFPYLKTYGENDLLNKIFNVHKDKSFDMKNNEGDLRMSSDSDMGGVAISQDGSLTAAWFGCKLTLWDTHLCSLRTTLSHPAMRPKGIHVKFGYQDAAHYLACTTESCVAVWSILSLTLKWLVQINAIYLAADPLSNKMAVTTTNNDVFIFSPQSSKPILSRKRLLDPKNGTFKQCTFGSSSGDDPRVYFMMNDSEIYCLEPEQTEEATLEVISRRNLPASNFSALLAEHQVSEVRPAVPSETQVFDISSTGNDAMVQFLNASSHMVPAVSLLCTSFLQNMAGQQKLDVIEETSEDQDEENMIVDLDSSEDETDSPRVTSFTPNATLLWTPNYDEIKSKKLNRVLRETFLDSSITETLFGV